MLRHAARHAVGRDTVGLGDQLHTDGMTDGNWLIVFKALAGFGELVVPALGGAHARERFPHLGVHAGKLDLARTLLTGTDQSALLGQDLEAGEVEAATL